MRASYDALRAVMMLAQLAVMRGIAAFVFLLRLLTYFDFLLSFLTYFVSFLSYPSHGAALLSFLFLALRRTHTVLFFLKKAFHFTARIVYHLLSAFRNTHGSYRGERSHR